MSRIPPLRLGQRLPSAHFPWRVICPLGPADFGSFLRKTYSTMGHCITLLARNSRKKSKVFNGGPGQSRN